MPDGSTKSTPRTAARDSGAVLDLLMSKINDAVLTIDNYRVVDCNPAALKALGRERDAIIGKTPWELSPEFQPDGQKSSDKAKAVMDAAMCGKPVRFEWLHEAPDGTKAWTDISLTRIEVDDRPCALAILRDTTELRTANAELTRQARFQRQKADILNDLTSLPEEEMAVGINDILKEIGALYGATRIFLWESDEATQSYDIVFGWVTGEPDSPEAARPPTYVPFDWVTNALQEGETLYIPNIDDAPDHARDLCELLEGQGSRAFLAMPMAADGAMFGASTFTSNRTDPWDQLAVDELESLSNILATCITRIRSTAAMQQHAALQSRLAAISSQLLDAEADEIVDALRETLAIIGKDYDLDRVTVNWFETRHPSYGLPIDWAPREDPPQQVMPSELPWGAAKVTAGEILKVDDVQTLPPEAAIDRALMEKLGYRSSLSIPLTYGPRVFGSMTVGTTEQRDWQDKFIGELGLFADLISNTTVRHWSLAELVGRERDLARSQKVASVGSFSLKVILGDSADSDYQNLSLSDEARRIFGLGDEDESLDSVIARIHPEDEPKVSKAWRSITQGRKAVDIQYRIVADDDTVRHVRANATLDPIDEQRMAKCFGTVMDVTDWVEAGRRLEDALAEVKELKDKLQEENRYLRDEVRAAHGFGTIIGNSRKLRGVLKLAEQVAPTDVTVLVTGETGTGKELVARAIHNQSPRRDRALVCVNCAAIAEELIESELFGHEKGAFTGAHAQRKGRFELADGGTLFLDEIGEMSGNLQSKLLRVIQEGEFERLGGTATLKTDVRIVAATNRDLMKAVDAGDFRADLYYRINSFPIHMPALRERKGDIPLLAEHLVTKHAARLGKTIESISERMMRYLQRQSWPGNIRELESAIVRALVTSHDTVLDHTNGLTFKDPEVGGAAGDDLEEVKRAHILEVLERVGWKIEGRKGAACALGMPPSSLRSQMRRLGIKRPDR